MIGVFGLGNLLMGDDGIGIEVIKFLEKNFFFPSEVELIDGGVGSFSLPFYKFKKVIIVDAVREKNKNPGDVILYDKKELTGGRIGHKISLHDLSLQEILVLLELRDELPEDMVFVGVVPLKVKMGIGLSSVLKKRISDIARKVVEVLNFWGIEVKKNRKV